MDIAADYAKGQALTLDSYTADYEAYRAELMGSTWSVPEGVLIYGVMLFGVFAIYEILGWMAGALIGRVLSQNPKRIDTRPDENQ